MLRYLISLIPFNGNFPIATLVTNILGALVIGFISGFAASGTVDKNAVLFLKTGVCGGFTTFSTFSLECFQLFESRKILTGSVYVIVSLSGCLLGVWAGTAFGKTVFSK